MAHPFGVRPPHGDGHGIRFTNEEWNGSITNGHPFTLEWNETILGEDAELGVFKVTYPREGVRKYELVSNLTELVQGSSYEWTPTDLDDELYTMWLTTVSNGNYSWAISPPWRLHQGRRGLHWAAPVGIPIVVLLGVYAASVMTCLLYRRRKRLKREKGEAEQLAAVEEERREEEEVEEEEDGRHPSVSSVSTTQTYTEELDEKGKTKVIITKSGDDITRPPEALLGPRCYRLGSASTTMSGSTWTEEKQLDGMRFENWSRKGSTWSEDIHFDGVRFDSRSRKGSTWSDDVQFNGVRFDRGRTGSVATESVPPAEDPNAAPGTAL